MRGTARTCCLSQGGVGSFSTEQTPGGHPRTHWCRRNHRPTTHDEELNTGKNFKHGEGGISSIRDRWFTRQTALGKLAGNWMNNISPFQAKHSISHLWVKDLNAKCSNKITSLEGAGETVFSHGGKWSQRGPGEAGCTAVKANLQHQESPSRLWVSYSTFWSPWSRGWRPHARKNGCVPARTPSPSILLGETTEYPNRKVKTYHGRNIK